ncbi:MAG: hypothetical protein AAF518_19575 [Spirochaetota bacterium]
MKYTTQLSEFEKTEIIESHEEQQKWKNDPLAMSGKELQQYIDEWEASQDLSREEFFTRLSSLKCN